MIDDGIVAAINKFLLNKVRFKLQGRTAGKGRKEGRKKRIPFYLSAAPIPDTARGKGTLKLLGRLGSNQRPRH
jgi:hypothetical protein